MEENIKKIESHLAFFDGKLEKFSKKYNFKLTKNSKDWPERSIKWRQEDINRLLQIYLKNELERIFIVWGCAWKDEKSKRFWYKTESKEISMPIGWDILNKSLLKFKNELAVIKRSDLNEKK